MSEPPREKTKSEKLYERLESRVSKLTSRVKVLETDLKKALSEIKSAVDEVNAVKSSYFKELARTMHGTEPPPAIVAPEPSSEPPTQPQPGHSKP